MTINNCFNESENETLLPGNPVRLVGLGTQNFHDVISTTNSITGSPGEVGSNGNRSVYATYPQCTVSLPQQQFTSCYEKQRHFNEYGNPVISAAPDGLNQYSSVATSSGTRSMSSNSLPPSPATIVSIPSPAEHKPTVAELECYRRQNQMPQAGVMQSPPQSSSPEMEEAYSYFQHSPPVHSFHQLPSEQMGNLSPNENCYLQPMTSENYSQAENNMNSYSQYSGTLAATTSSEFLPNVVQANASPRYETASYTGYNYPTNESVPMSGNSLLPFVANAEFSLENQHAIGVCEESGNPAAFSNGENTGYISPQYQTADRPNRFIRSKCKANKRGGKNMLPANPSDRLQDDELTKMTVRELNKWLRGLRYLLSVLFTS